jgi:hypothetical protein
MSKLDIMWVMLNQRIDDINSRLEIVEAKETAQTFDEVTQMTLAEAIASEPTGVAYRYITDGQREGGGTGTLAYYDPTDEDWLRASDNSVVTT